MFSEDEIKDDLIKLTTKEFYIKYIVRSENWYFENILGNKQSLIDDFRLITSENLKISFNNVLMVGSAKTGISLAPQKNFKKFDIINSDLDVVIISNILFLKYWDLFRKNYSVIQDYFYKNYVFRGIYRGFINEGTINSIDGCKREWREYSERAKKTLNTKLSIRNEVNFRIYRSWEDFEEYNLFSLIDLKNSYEGAKYGREI